MHPILFYLGDFPVYSYGVLLGVALLVGIWYAMVRAKKYQLSEEIVIEVSALSILGGVLGARLVYVLLNWEFYRSNLVSVFSFREGGLTFYGGIGGALLLVVVYTVVKKQSLPLLLDVFTPPIALGYAIARVGCFLNGCCYGRVSPFSSWPLAVHFPHLSGMRYPTQNYSSLYSLVILYLLLRMERKKSFEGELFLDYLWLYGISRFLVEYLRDEPFVVGGIFTIGQFACLWIIIGALSLRAIIKSRGQNHV